MKKQVWFQTNLGFYATSNKLRGSGIAAGDWQDYKGRLTFHVKDLKDFTIQITTHSKLGITYPESTGYRMILERLYPFLVKADGTQAHILQVKRQKTMEKENWPDVDFWVMQNFYGSVAKRQLPNVGFYFKNNNRYPIRVKIEARTLLGGKNLGLIKDAKGYYNGKAILGFEPHKGMKNANFTVPKKCVNSEEELTIEMRVTVIDPNGKEYALLPQGWTLNRLTKSWYLEPKGFTQEAE